MTPQEPRTASPKVNRVLSANVEPGMPRYTIGTLVTKPDQYAVMVRSLKAGGFSELDCEYLYIDNSKRMEADAYSGLNALLNAARAPFVILCHQDICLLENDRTVLDQRLAELTRRDPTWAVAGNAGGVAPGRLAMRITDPHGRDRCIGEFPERVTSLDENLLIVRRDARIGFSHDLTGFHFYGTDVCMHAAIMGRSSYVIDFHIEHFSPGFKGADFARCEAAFLAKWSRALAPRWVQTTCSLLRLSGDRLDAAIGRATAAPYAKLARRLPGARGWNGSEPTPA